MKWVQSDLLQYKSAKEYVDTLLIPLIPFQLSSDRTFEKDAFQKETMNLLVQEVERGLKGRIFLTPGYYYLPSKELDHDEVPRLNRWIQNCEAQPFEYPFLITFDATWKKFENDLDGTLLWLPGLDSGNLNSEEMQSVVKGQAKQIIELIRTYW
ncbi:MAG TPA: DUF2487 family protein [Virgibacillus sp.]|nr:DUF2487 family protein [Virgibacillus sp.]